MTTFADLLAQKADLESKSRELEKLLDAARKEDRKAVITQIKTLMAEHGLTVADLESTFVGNGRKAKAKKPGASVPPKYRHPKTGQEWSGRGLTPKWLKAEIDSGKTLDSFLIKS